MGAGEFLAGKTEKRFTTEVAEGGGDGEDEGTEKTRTLKGAGPSTSLRTEGAAPTFWNGD